VSTTSLQRSLLAWSIAECYHLMRFTMLTQAQHAGPHAADPPPGPCHGQGRWAGTCCPVHPPFCLPSCCLHPHTLLTILHWAAPWAV
jgi:hypothetical protein